MYDPSSAVVELLDSISLLCSEYGRALQLAEGEHPPDLTISQAKALGTQIFQNWAMLQQVLHALHYRVHAPCPWKCSGHARMDGPPPTRDMADLRLGKAFALMLVTRPPSWTDEDSLRACQARDRLRAAYAEVLKDMPEVLRVRARHPVQLAPACAELTAHLLHLLASIVCDRGPSWKIAAMLSNTQEAPLEAIPGEMPMPTARRLHEQLVRDPDQGLNALAALGAIAGVLLWAPFGNQDLQQLLTTCAVAAVQVEDPPTLLLVVPHGAYPGVEAADFLYDLWKHPLQHRDHKHLIRDVGHIAMPVRCVLMCLQPAPADRGKWTLL